MLDAMIRHRALRLLSVILLSMLASVLAAQSRAHADLQPITLTPAIVAAGSPELIRVVAPEDARLEGEWLGRKIEFFHARNGSAWLALAGVDVEAKTGPSTLSITVKPAGGGAARDLSRTIEIHPAHYHTESLTVSPKFVEPGPDAMKEIEEESKLKAKIYAASVDYPEWSGSFRAPVKAQPTDSFGTRRMFNGKLSTRHMGMDFRAASGTVVRASNSGVVVLARHLYYEGNCVILDHGQGFFTLSMHFSRIDVKEGQHVSAGDRLGLSGATGRVTGPHLHWAVRWHGANLDPAKLLTLDLSQAH